MFWLLRHWFLARVSPREAGLPQRASQRSEGGLLASSVWEGRSAPRSLVGACQVPVAPRSGPPTGGFPQRASHNCQVGSVLVGGALRAAILIGAAGSGRPAEQASHRGWLVPPHCGRGAPRRDLRGRSARKKGPGSFLLWSWQRTRPMPLIKRAVQQAPGERFPAGNDLDLKATSSALRASYSQGAGRDVGMGEGSLMRISSLPSPGLRRLS